MTRQRGLRIFARWCVMAVLVLVLLLGCGGNDGPAINNRAPVARAGPDQNVTTGTVVTVDGSGSTDANNDPLTYHWTLLSKPAGSAAVLSNATTEKPTFMADRSGVYVLSLVVNDGQSDGVADTVEITAAVGDSGLVADAGPDQTVTTGSIVTLDGSGSRAADGVVLTYSWGLFSKPIGSTTVLNSVAIAPTFKTDREGTYVAFLFVSDGAAYSNTDNVTITAITPPTAPVANAGPDQDVATGSVVILDGSRSMDANGDPLTYSWLITSRPAGSAAVFSSATEIRPTFVADRDGTYLAQLVVSDGSFISLPETVEITASPVISSVVLPKTGQSVSYIVGDDGELQTGVAWPSPRFSDNGDGTVSDNLTGLVWLKDGNCIKTEYPSFDNDLQYGGYGFGDGLVTWQSALDFVKGINAGTYSRCGAGYSDWRLPNVRELRSLVDYSRWAPALPQGHPFVNLTGYWSSTTDVGHSNEEMAWTVWIHAGGVVTGIGKASAGWAVLPVRSGSTEGAPAPVPKTGQVTCYDAWGVPISCAGTGQDGDYQAGIAWPNPRFAVGTGAETECVVDHLTGLMWARSPSNTPMLWDSAIDNANNLSLCGYSDWRMPNINELESLVGWGESSEAWLEREGFDSAPQGIYWSSTTNFVITANNAWITGPIGGIGGAPKSSPIFPYYGRPVRGGR